MNEILKRTHSKSFIITLQNRSPAGQTMLSILDKPHLHGKEIKILQIGHLFDDWVIVEFLKGLI